MGCGPVSGPSSLKHNTYRVPSCSVTDARLATYPGRSSSSKVWNSPQSSTVSNLRPKRSSGGFAGAVLDAGCGTGENAPLQLERVSRSELNLDPTVVGLLSGDRQCRLSHVNAQNRQSQRGEVKSVLAGPAARIEHRSGESAFGCQTHYCWLRPANIPRRSAVAVRRIPGQSRQPFMTGWVPTTERIVSAGS